MPKGHRRKLRLWERRQAGFHKCLEMSEVEQYERESLCSFWSQQAPLKPQSNLLF